MTAAEGPPETPQPELAELVRQIASLQDALTRLSSGGVDAVVLGSPENEQVYTLTNADRPYRVIVERMGEGAATVSESGAILVANPRLAEFIGIERDRLVGRNIADFVDADQEVVLRDLLQTVASETRRAEVRITATGGVLAPVLVSATALDLEGVLVRCLIFTDLTMQKQAERQLVEDLALAARQRLARDVNDTIVQGLVVAEMALDLERYDEARTAIASTSARARRWIGELAVDAQIMPGGAVLDASDPAPSDAR